MPERETTPMSPGLWMYPGMMPILHSPGVMMPGQFGPIRRDLRAGHVRLHLDHVEDGMPSVMQMTSSMPAATASSIASAANAGGT